MNNNERQLPDSAFDDGKATTFASIDIGYNTVFRPNRSSLGLVVPVEAYGNAPVPTLTDHLERVQSAEALGFSAVWLRDVPFNVPEITRNNRCEPCRLELAVQSI